jgi:putative endonuclease
VYVLRCADATLYTGATNDLVARLARHQAGKGARYTRARLPVELVYSERARDRSAALRREAQLKRLSRKEKLEVIARGARPRAPRRAGAPARLRGTITRGRRRR